MDTTVAVDFGTTYSSVSCCQRRIHSDAKTGPDGESSRGESSHHYPNLIRITSWPDAPKGGKHAHREVPTEILIHRDRGDIVYGYTVQKTQKFPSHVDYVRLHKFKLLLDASDYAREGRREATDTLRRAGLDREEAIYLFLVFLLEHTKAQLTEHHGYNADHSVQLVATTPAIWTGQADTIMAQCLARAAQHTQFGHENDVFLVSEPDALATFHCTNDKSEYPFLELGDDFTICDCGGGTVDLITYQYLHMWPLRIDEVVAGDGDLCGSSYVDNDFYDWILQVMKEDLRYSILDKQPGGFRKAADMATADFEMVGKRQFDGKDSQNWVSVPGAPTVGDAWAGSMIVDSKIIEGLFQKRLDRIVELIRSQIRNAQSKGHKCTKVLVAGGFSHSAYFQSYLPKVLRECKIQFLFTEGSAVSDGAIIRYLNRTDGPAEIIRASYGFTRYEHYSPDDYEGHHDANCTPVEDEEDGHIYVRDCITYFARKGEVIPPGGKTFNLLDFDTQQNVGSLTRTFPSLVEDLTISLEVYANNSDYHPPNKFEVTHPRNNGCISQGRIEFTIPSAVLRQDPPGHRYRTKDGRRKRYYILEYSANFRKSGKNIRYELWFRGQRKVQGLLTPNTQTALPDLEERLQGLEM